MRISDWSSDVCSSDLMIKLRNLIALRQVSVKIVFAVETRPFVDDRAHGHAGSYRLPDAFSVGDRQHAGHGCVDQAHLCIRLSTKGRGGSGEELRLRRDLRMDLQADDRSDEHTYELQSLLRNSYAVFCLKKKKNIQTI